MYSVFLICVLAWKGTIFKRKKIDGGGNRYHRPGKIFGYLALELLVPGLVIRSFYLFNTQHSEELDR